MSAFLRSFAYAGKGLRLAVREERNFRFHLCAGFYVFLFSTFFPFGRLEYALLATLVGGVLALELVNSALERAMENPPPQRYALAGAVKDMAAGAVLVFCIGAAVCACFLFGNLVVWQGILLFFLGHIYWLLLLVFSFGLAVWFIFFFPAVTKKQNLPQNRNQTK